MNIGKKLLRHPVTRNALSWLLYFYIRLAVATSRIVRHIDAAAMGYMQGAENAIFAFWHGRMMPMPTFEPPGRKMRVLISLHRDGALISSVIEHFGEATINGSSSKGGREAVMEMLRALKAGDNVSITPDGPRGPVQIVQPGIVAVAKLSGRPVLPVTFSSNRHKRFSSWDRFMLALPLGRIVFRVGAPIFVDREADNEAARLQIEQAMNALVAQADAEAHA